jgi:hypothetical protein
MNKPISLITNNLVLETRVHGENSRSKKRKQEPGDATPQRSAASIDEGRSRRDVLDAEQWGWMMGNVRQERSSAAAGAHAPRYPTDTGDGKRPTELRRASSTQCRASRQRIVWKGKASLPSPTAPRAPSDPGTNSRAAPSSG